MVKDLIDRNAIEAHVKQWLAFTPKIAVAVKKDNGFGLMLLIKGEWLIKHGLAEEWYKVRGIEHWAWTPEGIVDGKITDRFQDMISLDQARLLGFLGDYGGGGY